MRDGFGNEYTLDVLVKRAKNLPLFDKSGHQSSVFTVGFQGWKSKSKVFDNDLNPRYNEMFTFPIGMHGIIEDDKIGINVETYKTTGRGRSLGNITRIFPVSELRSGKAVNCSWALSDNNGCLNGATIELELKAKFWPELKVEEKKIQSKPINTTLLPKEVDTYRLRFLVHKCTKLVQSPCSAIVVIRFGTDIKSTQICELTQDPEFEEEINFVVYMSQRDIAKEIVTIEVLNTLRTDKEAVVGDFKFMVETGFTGEAVGWDEPAYEANTVCRTMTKKWIILTNPFQTPKNINGFVNMSFSVLQSGQSLEQSPIIDPIILDVLRNVMRPSEVTAQYKRVYFRVYLAEDLPIMDNPDDMSHVMEKMRLTRAAFCDPYVGISYCGVEARTSINYANYNPRFNTDIIFNIEIPAVTDTVVITLYDYDADKINSADILATKHLSLTEISYLSDDEYGFDPTFGPSLVPFYGSPKHFEHSQHPELNEGANGIGYRGRILLEVFTKPSFSVGMFANTAPAPEEAIKRAAKGLRTQKCVLVMGAMEATMIPKEFADNPVSFEISVGEFGYANSLFTNPTTSKIWPQAPLFDSVNYYWLEFDIDQACIIPMEWEHSIFRLEHLNILERIRDFYRKSLDDIDDDIQKEKIPADIISSMKILVKRTIDRCGITLPDLPDSANNLDKNQKSLREMKLRLIIQECKKLARGSLDGTPLALKLLQKILQILDEICCEPQIEIPNVIVYMFSGDKLVAYFSSPIHYFLESSVAKGKDCERMMYMDLKSTDGRDMMAAQLLGFLWFGTEKMYKEDFQFPYDGRISSYAEMYENEIITNGRWGVKNLTRPQFSNEDGTMQTPKDFFTVPKGWTWEGEWEIQPKKGSLVSEEFTLKEWVDRRYETVNYFDPGDIETQWWNKDMIESSAKDEVKLSSDWEWTHEWVIDSEEPGDVDGWSYTHSPDSQTYTCSEKKGNSFKRRMWKRERVRNGPPVLPDIKEVVEKKGGWVYSKTFKSKFNIEELSTDMVRRRRWIRNMSSMDPYAVTFSTKTANAVVTVAPSLLLKFPDMLRYEVRVHIFQGRTLTSPDIMGYVTVYGIVCVSGVTHVTRTIEHQLSPTFDQTLKFEDIEVIGSSEYLHLTRPKVTILLFHKGPQGDVFIGRTSMFPDIANIGVSHRMKWHEVELKGNYAGDILGMAQIYRSHTPEDKALLPFDPPVMPDGMFQLPPGIRPVMKLTRIEILSWGLRKLKFWNSKPIDHPRIEIECGGSTTTLAQIENVKLNSNFPETSTFFDILLPEGNTYKPPINIRLLDKRGNGFIPLVGKYVVTEFAKFDPEYLAKVMAATDKIEKQGGGGGDEEENSLYSSEHGTSVSTDSTVVIIEDENEGQTGCMACLSKMVKVVSSLMGTEVLDETDDWEFLSMYWWSRYYAMQGNTLLYKTFKHHELPMISVFEKEIEFYYNNFADSIQQFKLQTVAKLKESKTDEDLEKDPIIGVYKGSFRIYQLEDGVEKPLLYASVPTSKPLRVLIRVYCLEGIQLACNSPIKDRYCDAYIQLQIGPKIIKDVGSLVRKTRNPRFSKIYNVETILPNFTELSVSAYDFEATEEKHDKLIGETKIDIENRFLSIKRPICSLIERYMIGGPHKWRDFMMPTQILDEYCVANGIFLPSYSTDGTTCIIASEAYTLEEFEKHKENFEDRKVWGPAKERVALYVLLELGLIRDHVEKRNLYNPVLPGVSQGRLLMWCDIFPYMESPPEPMNIDPPLPVEMELRVIVYDCIDVATVEEEPPEDASADTLHDLVSKSKFVGEKEADVSEIHVRAINGGGSFNWRFLHKFHYAYLERKVIVEGEIEDQKFDPVITLNISDADPSIAPLPYGSVSLNLANCPRGATDSAKCHMSMIPGYEKPPELIEEEEESGKKETIPKLTYLSVFKKKKTLGWWPIYVKKPNGYMYQTGMISCELEVMTKAQAAKRPAGTGRGEPNTNPVIEEPIRIPTTFPVIDSKVKMVKFIWKSPNKPKLILGLIAQLVGGLLAGFLLNASGMVTSLLGVGGGEEA
ncbi:myoferlin-like [Bolinopsis microptera]|uniref:myoferlin-like n=1 Tax=Bolinopsis microptera TaxID=2820187 RepID=UPI003078BEF8